MPVVRDRPGHGVVNKYSSASFISVYPWAHMQPVGVQCLFIPSLSDFQAGPLGIPVLKVTNLSVLFWKNPENSRLQAMTYLRANMFIINFVYWLAIRKSRVPADTAATWDHYTRQLN